MKLLRPAVLALLPFTLVACDASPTAQPTAQPTDGPVKFRKTGILPDDKAPQFKQDAKSNERPTLRPDGLPTNEEPLTPEQIIPLDLQGRLEVDSRVGAPARVFFPRTLLKTGDNRQIALGQRNDGGVLTYEVGGPNRGQIPVTVTLRMWGSVTLYNTFVARLTPGTTTDFFAATPDGRRAKITLFLEALAPLPTDTPEFTPGSITPVPVKKR